MRRWATEKIRISVDQEELHHVEIYADENKEVVKADNRIYSYTRLLLVPENRQIDSRYSIAKISRI